MARSFATSLSVLIPLLFLSLGSALQLGLSVGTMAHSVGQENSPTLAYEYQVFVSFSEDTHKNFTCHLFVALDRKGIHVYKSGFIRTELLKAIEKSRIAVVVFSKNYGNSNWCLDELVKIMECKRLFNQRVIPIFYDVSPSDVRKQKGKAILNGSEDKVNSWRVALTNSANLAGLHLKPYRLESEFIEEIVENIWKILNEESATAPSCRQIDVSSQQSVPIIPPQNHASSCHNYDISQRLNLSSLTGCIAETPCPYRSVSDRYHMSHCYTAPEELIYTFGGPWLFGLLLMGLLVLLALVLSATRMKFVGVDELPGPAPTQHGSLQLKKKTWLSNRSLLPFSGVIE